MSETFGILDILLPQPPFTTDDADDVIASGDGVSFARKAESSATFPRKAETSSVGYPRKANR